MKRIIFPVLLFLSGSVIYGQASKNALHDADIKTKLEKIKDNINNLFEKFKTDKQPNPEINFDGGYYTNISFFNIKGTVESGDFDESMNFRISSGDYKKATGTDFENAFNQLAENLKTVFDFLDIREKNEPGIRELTLFEKGTDTNLPIANPGSPHNYINLKYEYKAEGKNTTNSIFLIFNSKKKK